MGGGGGMVSVVVKGVGAALHLFDPFFDKSYLAALALQLTPLFSLLFLCRTYLYHQKIRIMQTSKNYTPVNHLLKHYLANSGLDRRHQKDIWKLRDYLHGFQQQEATTLLGRRFGHL